MLYNGINSKYSLSLCVPIVKPGNRLRKHYAGRLSFSQVGCPKIMVFIILFIWLMDGGQHDTTYFLCIALPGAVAQYDAGSRFCGRPGITESGLILEENAAKPKWIRRYGFWTGRGPVRWAHCRGAKQRRDPGIRLCRWERKPKYGQIHRIAISFDV